MPNDHKKLIAELREHAASIHATIDALGYVDVDPDEFLLSRAADAIEELTADK